MKGEMPNARIDKTIQTYREFYKERTDQVNGKIVDRISDRLFWSSGQEQQRAHEQVCRERGKQCKDDKQNESVSKDLSGANPVALS